MLLNREELFLYTVRDLRTKIRTNSTYSLIRACGLCRQLLLDSPSLVDQVNKPYKLSLKFHIKDHRNAPLSINYKGAGSRTILPIGNSKFVGLNEFLATRVLHSGKNEFTVKEIINTACHYYGGIHAGKPDTKQSSLIWLNSFYDTQTNTSFWLLGVICKVILKSLKPLEMQVNKSISTGGLTPHS